MLLLTDITWTDQLTAVSSLGQCLALCAGLYIAMRELGQSRSFEVAKATDNIFDRFAEKSVDEAISRISTDEVNPVNDRMMIKSILAGDDMERKEQCEADILLLTNLYSRIWDQFDNRLIEQNRFLQNFDEITLYICHALATAYEDYAYADYQPLMRLALRCQPHYRSASYQKNDLLWRIPISQFAPRRFKAEMNTAGVVAENQSRLLINDDSLCIDYRWRPRL